MGETAPMPQSLKDELEAADTPGSQLVTDALTAKPAGGQSLAERLKAGLQRKGVPETPSVTPAGGKVETATVVPAAPVTPAKK